jgi:hypothetical protein
VLSANATTVTIPATGTLPQTYNRMRLYYKCRGTSPDNFDVLQMQFNGDAAADYDSQRVRIAGTALNVNADADAGSTVANVANVPAGGTIAGEAAAGVVEVVGYADSWHKLWQAHGSAAANPLSPAVVELAGGEWLSTAGITVIALSLSAGQFASGSTFMTELA